MNKGVVQVRKSPCKIKDEKEELQKRIQKLQEEREELKEKLRECEARMKIKEKRYRRKKQELSALEAKLTETTELSGSKYVLYKKIYSWMLYGIFLTIMPLMSNWMDSRFFCYDIKPIDIIADFVMVLYAISGNLLGIMFDYGKHNRFDGILHFLAMLLWIVSYVLLSLTLDRYGGLQNGESQLPQMGKLLFTTIFAIIAVVALGILVIVRHNKPRKNV